MNSRDSLHPRLMRHSLSVKDAYPDHYPLRVYICGEEDKDSVQGFNTWDEVSAFLDGLDFCKENK